MSLRRDEMKKVIQMVSLVVFGLALSGCAHQTLKAPCGPTAGLTDACGNRTPINGVKQVLNTDFNKAGTTAIERV